MTHVDTGLRSDRLGRIWLKAEADPSNGIRVFLTITDERVLMRLNERDDTRFFSSPPCTPLVDMLTRTGLPAWQPEIEHFRPTVKRPVMRPSRGKLTLTRATPLIDASGAVVAELTFVYTHRGLVDECTLFWQPLPNDDEMLPYRSFMRDIAIPPNNNFKFEF